MPFAVNVHNIEVVPGVIVNKLSYNFSRLISIGGFVEVPENILKFVGAKHLGMAAVLPAGVFVRVANLAGLGTGISRCGATNLY